MENYFSTLNVINVNDRVEKKNGLKYLSWAWAWGEIKKHFPDASYVIYEASNGCFYHTDGRTCWVKTGVTVNGIEHIEYLPVMDYKNKSIPLDEVTSFDVNKAIQRSLTKACARHGLGLYIYAGEDLPEEEEKRISLPPREKHPVKQAVGARKLNILAAQKQSGCPNADVIRFMATLGKDSYDDLTESEYVNLLKRINEWQR